MPITSRYTSGTFAIIAGTKGSLIKFQVRPDPLAH